MTHSRPLASKAICIGFWMSGSLATSCTSNPAGTVKRLLLVGRRLRIGRGNERRRGLSNGGGSKNRENRKCGEAHGEGLR